jgi:hypothetical protein
MTSDDIRRMAREAGMFWFDYGSNDGDANMLEKFAALVATAEREACVELCLEHSKLNVDNASAHEFGKQAGAATCATAIRARGEV